ncbi:hypothetical protein [Acidipropionibacterium virtanenii]|uniref:Uncharacterized protein n=1 Tax=Acidipropionibacterium virtanenii TaxID=2057246 RepID=A0A344UR27_9ACTN|nr:hypothetical protein [Acidipropionibacterium virtanenii]AXE37725.1 hypothetical protein JS278_00532 [Acidipropionibacterium virtanenii]
MRHGDGPDEQDGARFSEANSKSPDDAQENWSDGSRSNLSRIEKPQRGIRYGVGIGAMLVLVALGISAVMFLGRAGLLPLALCVAGGGYITWRQFHPHIP